MFIDLAILFFIDLNNTNWFPQTLRLDHNWINSIAPAAFMSSYQLESLTMSHNQLSELKPGVFLNLTKLKILDISNNPISELAPQLLQDVPALKIIKCRHCKLGRVPPGLHVTTQRLYELDLRDNLVQNISVFDFTELKYLKIVRLDGNLLFKLGDKIFEGVSLRWLGLSRNGLRIISQNTFSKCHIHDIDLSSNDLWRISLLNLLPIMRRIHHLELNAANISNNALTFLLKNARNLEVLKIGRNNLSYVSSELFEKQFHLKILILSHNQLKHIPLSLLQNLEKLNYLDLSFNKFSGFPETITRRFEKIKRIKLNGNPWKCDQCHIPYLKNWLNKSNIFRNACHPNVDDSNCLKCEHPFEMNDRPIVEIGQYGLQPCSQEELILPVSNSYLVDNYISILIIVVTIFTILILLLMVVIAKLISDKNNIFSFLDDPRSEKYSKKLPQYMARKQLPREDKVPLDDPTEDHRTSFNEHDFAKQFR